MCVPIERAQYVTIVRVDKNGRNREEDSVIKEHALSIALSDEKFVRNRHYVTVFCIPFDLDILGLGFLLSDDIINSMDDVKGKVKIVQNFRPGVKALFNLCLQHF